MSAIPAAENPSLASDLQSKDDRPVFPGVTLIYCDGLMVTSGASSWLWLTFLLIYGPLILFLLFSHKTFLTVLQWYWLMPAYVLVVFCTASALMTAYTDPGVLPRHVNPRDEITMNGSTDYGGQPESLLVYHPNCPDVLMGKQITNNGVTVFLKYCSTCQIFRPPRASHCSFCDNCVEEFDHHCPWVSNCVGRRNYRFFLVFLIELALLVDYVFGLLVVMLHRLNTNGIFETVAEYGSVASIASMCFACGLAVNWLLIYNLMLIARDRTTSESIKGYESGTHRSGWENCARVFCSQRPNRNLPWRMYQSRF